MHEELLALIRDLAEMAEPGARAVWEVALQQQYNAGLLGAIGGGLLLLIGLGLLAWAFWGDWNRIDGPVLQVLFGILLSIGGFTWLVDSTLRLMNPAYYAAKALADML